MEYTRKDLEQLLERRTKEVDVKGNIMVVRMKRNLKRHRRARQRNFIILGLIATVVAYVVIRLTITTDQLYPALSNWWTEKAPSSEQLRMRDVVLQLEYSWLQKAMSTIFLSKSIPSSGAKFLAQMIQERGHTLEAYNWDGSGQSPEAFLFGGGVRIVPSKACLRAQESGGGHVMDAGVPWIELMERWSAKVWKDGTPAPSVATFGNTSEIDVFLPDDDMKAGLKKFVNPWASFFSFSTPSSMSGSWVIQDYLCAEVRSLTVLHTLFMHGLVGVARRHATDDETANDLIRKLTGWGGEAVLQRRCRTKREMAGMDAFMVGTGVTSMIAPMIPAASLGIAGIGLLGSVGAAVGFGVNACK